MSNAEQRDRLRVYVSSTFVDLIEFRSKVNERLRRAGFDLIAMEDYPAFDSRPLDKCLADVATCDVFVGVLAKRSGFVPPQPDGTESFAITELEYRQAGSSGIPRLMFQLDPKVPWPEQFDDRITGSADRGEHIARFRALVSQEHGLRLFHQPEELAGLVLEAIQNHLTFRGRAPTKHSTIEDRRTVSSIEAQLELMIYQYGAAVHLENARRAIANAETHQTLSKRETQRLSLIGDILQSVFLGGAGAVDRDSCLVEFMSAYSADPWVPLLSLAARYADLGQSLSGFAIPLSEVRNDVHPTVATTCCLVGVLLIRASRLAKNRADRVELASEAYSYLTTAIERLNGKTEEWCQSAAGSAVCLQGIAHFYRGAREEAIACFEKASLVTSVVEQARGLNACAFVHLMAGRIAEAEVCLIEALDRDPEYALARSNFGYVLLAKREYQRARTVFARNASDDRLKKRSPRDVMLARLALCHSQELEGSPIPDVIGAYETILRDAGAQDYAAIQPDELRLGYMRLAAAEKLYRGRVYFGLEVFGLALLSRAALDLEGCETYVASETRYARLMERIEEGIQALYVTIDQTWFLNETDGWFGSIHVYYLKRHSDASAISSQSPN